MAGDIIVDPVKELAKSLIIDSIKEWFAYVKSYNDNMKEFQEKFDRLVALKDTFNNQVEQRKQENLHKSTKLTDNWLTKVQNLIDEIEKDEKLKHLIDDKTRRGKDQCCFGRVNCNLYQRYEMSKSAKLKVGEIDSVIEEKPADSDITEPLSDLKSTPNEFMLSLSSRVKLMENILKKLRDDQVNVVGISGMGAIGKTTLAKEIANTGAKDMFEKIVMVEISESPNVERIQDQIAAQLKLNNLNSSQSIEDRARSLYNALIRYTKVLVVLDNIWGKLDLGKLGIPQPYVNAQQESCCKLLVTSRSKDVCEVVGASEDNIFEVRPLDENESRLLFRTRVGAKVDDGSSLNEQQLEMEKRMLVKCGGLPLAIVALADVLKNQELSTWEHFATELEKPISISQSKISGVHRQAYSILETSYKLIESEEKRMFFLLACLFPFGASIPVEDMMRYGIGLGLFQHVDNLIEAIELAKTWVDELKSSSLLLDDDQFHSHKGIGYTKIHDVVRASTISLAEKGGNMVMVDAFRRWLLYETCQKYYAISLMSGADHCRLNGLNSDKLQILILYGSQPEDRFSDSFFEGMINLKVLVLEGMDFTLGLPNSMRKLKRSLKTLHLEYCKFGDITGIGELTNLVILSLRESYMEETPKEIGNLCNLRLLDLSHCKIEKGGIAANVLSKLSLLEGLYAFCRFYKWHYGNCVDGEYEYASIGELNHLRYLKVIQLTVRFNEWPIDENQLQFLKNLDHFRISFGYNYPTENDYHIFRVVSLYDNRDLSNTKDISMIRVLLENTQYYLVYLMEKLQHIFDYDDEDDIHGKQQQYQPKLQSYNNFHALPPPAVEFPFLQLLGVQGCPKMKSLSSTPFKAPNFTSLSVRYCENMKYIFMEYPFIITTTSTTFPALKKMDLYYLPKLESVTGYIKSSTTTITSTPTNDDDPQPPRHILFNYHKPTFPKLEVLSLEECEKIGQLWEVNCKEMSYYSSFNNLYSLRIETCDKLETLGSLSIATALVRLKTLLIKECSLLREVISSSKEEEEEETKAPIFGDEIFPSLQSVELKDCPKLEMFIKGGKFIKDQFLYLSSLHLLEIEGCPKMDSLGPSIKTPKLNKVTLDSSEYTMDETKDDINSFLLNHNKPN